LIILHKHHRTLVLFTNSVYTAAMGNTSSSRPRGGQPGNRNALKHGFYSHENKPASSGDSIDLTDEIQVLRLIIRDYLSLDRSQYTLEQELAYMRSVCLAFAVLTRLIKTQHWLSSNQDDVAKSVLAAIAEVNKEMNLSL
jgi:hypothetical protein